MPSARPPKPIPWNKRPVIGYALWILVFFLILLPFQSDFAASSISRIDVESAGDHRPIEAVIRIDSFNDATNSATATVTAIAKPPLAAHIKAGTATIKVLLSDGNNTTAGPSHIATLVLDKNSFTEGLYGVESKPVPAILPMYHQLAPYPFDKYTSYLSILTLSDDIFPVPQLSTSIVKMVAGRVVQVSGTSDVFNVTLVRPGIQQIFISASGLVFMAIIIGIGVRINRSPTSFNPVSQSMTVASFLLGAAGFRDLMGFSKLASFSVAEAFIVGVPLLLLAFAFFRSSITAVPPKKDDESV